MESFCQSCGRPFSYKESRAGVSNEVKYCSKKCRTQKRDKKEKFIEIEILNLLNQRSVEKSICPSEVARIIDPENFRQVMEDVRCAGRRLMLEGKILITQKKQVVKSLNFKGPVRFKLK